MATKTKLVVATFTVFAVGYAILQSIMGLIWESERINLGIIPACLFAGSFYLLVFFLSSRQRPATVYLVICFIVVISIVALLLAVNCVGSLLLTTEWIVPTIIRSVYFSMQIQVAEHQAKRLHKDKVG